MSYCKFCIYTHPLNSKFTTRWYVAYSSGIIGLICLYWVIWGVLSAGWGTSNLETFIPYQGSAIEQWKHMECVWLPILDVEVQISGLLSMTSHRQLLWHQMITLQPWMDMMMSPALALDVRWKLLLCQLSYLMVRALLRTMWRLLKSGYLIIIMLQL